MSKKFTSKLEKAGSWTIVRVPFDAKKEFGSAGYTPVIGSIDGLEFNDITLMPMGGGVHCFPVKAEIRKAIGKEDGDPVKVVLEKNPNPPVAETPAELKEAFKASKAAKKMFGDLSNAMRKEYCKYIAEGKQKETRVKRAVATVLKLEKLYLEKTTGKKL